MLIINCFWVKTLSKRTLQEDQIWDIYKYWEMETVLFEIIQLYGCKQKNYQKIWLRIYTIYRCL